MEIKKLSKGLRKRPDGTIIIDKWINGIHLWETLGKISEREAERILALRMAAAHGAIPNQVLSAGLNFNKCALTVKDVLKRYWEQHVQYLTSAKRNESFINNLIERIGNENVMTMRKDRVRKYLRDRQREHRVHWKIKRDPATGKKLIDNGEPVWEITYGKLVGIKSAKEELKILRAAINDAVENNLIQTSPFPLRIDWGIRGKREPVILDDGIDNGPVWNAIYSNANEEIKPLLLTLYETAMRPAECFAFRWSWVSEIETNRWIITVPDIEETGNGNFWKEKTGNKHRIPVSAKLMETLKSLRKTGSSLVFPSPVFLVQGEERMRNNIKTAWTTALRRADLLNQGYTVYCLRRTRLSIWDAIDTDCSRYCGGHSPRGVHERHYIKYNNSRLFKLVGLELAQKLKLLKAVV